MYVRSGSIDLVELVELHPRFVSCHARNRLSYQNTTVLHNTRWMHSTAMMTRSSKVISFSRISSKVPFQISEPHRSAERGKATMPGAKCPH